MTAEELFAEAHKIARPCVYLQGVEIVRSKAAGVWGGKGLIPFDVPGHRHWLTVDCNSLPKGFEDLRLTGAFSVYSDEKKYRGGSCVFDPNLTSIEIDDEDEDDLGDEEELDEEDELDDEYQNGEVTSFSRSLLVAHQGTSLPSFSYLLHFPTPAVQAWLTSLGYDPAKSDDQLPKQITETYENMFHETEVHRKPDNPYCAVLGGWPIEIYERTDAWDVRQLVFTFHEAEPWIQVLVDRAGKVQVERIIT